MPILPLEGSLPIVAVHGAMLFPTDKSGGAEKRSAYMNYYLRKAAAEMIEAGFTELPEDIEQARHMDVRLPRSIERRWDRGWTMGELFKVHFDRVMHDKNTASWYNSRRAVRHGMSEAGIEVSDVTLRRVQSDFMPAAHLWAAFVLRDGRIASDPSIGLTFEDDLFCFLKEAEILRYFGRNWWRTYEEDKREAPVLNVETWRVPPDWQPPKRKPGWPFAKGEINWYTIDPTITERLRRKGQRERPDVPKK